jgi:hypothetical protein
VISLTFPKTDVLTDRPRQADAVALAARAEHATLGERIAQRRAVEAG